MSTEPSDIDLSEFDEEWMARSYCAIRDQEVLDPWRQLKDKPLLVTAIGVDSGTVVVGDLACFPAKIYTASGDGQYPVYAKMIDGHRCLVIDFDVSSDGNKVFEDRDSPHYNHNWKCPVCGEANYAYSGSLGKCSYTCKNFHVEDFTAKEVAGFELYKHEGGEK